MIYSSPLEREGFLSHTYELQALLLELLEPSPKRKNSGERTREGKNRMTVHLDDATVDVNCCSGLLGGNMIICKGMGQANCLLCIFLICFPTRCALFPLMPLRADVGG